MFCNARRYLLLFLCIAACVRAQSHEGWDTYGGDSGGQRYSTSAQLTPANVDKMHQLWAFHTHALDRPRLGAGVSSFEATPVLFRAMLILTSPFDEVFALDAKTGAKQWSFDPKTHLAGDKNITTSRGVAIYRSSGQQTCANRVFLGTLDGRLLALDAVTGVPCPDFGNSGQVDLTTDVGFHKGDVYEVTSAPTVIGNTVVVGSSIPDSQRVKELRGTIHAFDVHTGKLRWAYDPIGTWASEQPAADRTGAANAWSTISADPELDLVFIPTGSASPDHWGGKRLGADRDANSVVAIQGSTGKRVWAFQLVHHDLWDYDAASEPLLFRYHEKTPALAIAGKNGLVFILDRRTGQPLVPVDERPVPTSNVPGEQSWPTQPFSRMPSFSGTNFQTAPGTAFNGSSYRSEECAAQIAGKRYEGIYTPPAIGGTVEYPGAIGGVNWGGLAYDPVHELLYANVNSDMYAIELIPKTEFDRVLAEREPLPRWMKPLLLIGQQHRVLLVCDALFVLMFVLIRRVAVRRIALGLCILSVVLAAMPPSAAFYRRHVAHHAAYHPNGSRQDDFSIQAGTPYIMHRRPIADGDGNPCTGYPWGNVVALNLKTLQIEFRAVHGPSTGGQPTGSFSVSGPIATAGGLLFSAGTKATALYVYNSGTGERLRALPLPAAAQATPMTYTLEGKQYVVICAGGHGTLGTVQGDSVVAFGL